MAPSAIEEPAAAAPPERTYPPAKIFPVKEIKFESFTAPQPDGRKKALSHSDAAIVIDNGKSPVCAKSARPRRS